MSKVKIMENEWWDLFPAWTIDRKQPCHYPWTREVRLVINLCGWNSSFIACELVIRRNLLDPRKLCDKASSMQCQVLSRSSSYNLLISEFIFKPWSHSWTWTSLLNHSHVRFQIKVINFVAEKIVNAWPLILWKRNICIHDKQLTMHHVW